MANAERAQAQAAGELLEMVNAQAYLPEPIRASRLADILDTLLGAHRGFNNFYNEPSPARALEAFVGDRGDVPPGVYGQFTATLVRVFLSNGHGVAHAAEAIYRRLLDRLDSEQAALALRAIKQPTVAIKLQYELCQQQWSELLEILRPSWRGAPIVICSKPSRLTKARCTKCRGRRRFGRCSSRSEHARRNRQMHFRLVALSPAVQRRSRGPTFPLFSEPSPMSGRFDIDHLSVRRFVLATAQKRPQDLAASRSEG